jgi:hypothetical protein
LLPDPGAIVISSPAMEWKIKLYFGDNLEILRDSVATGAPT